MNTFVFVSQLVLLLSLSSLAYAAKTEPKGECLPIGTSDDDTSLFHCVSTQEMTPCQDEHANCMNWAKQGECSKNAAYMIFNCRKSCETCVRYVWKYEQSSAPCTVVIQLRLPLILVVLSLHHGTTQRCHSLEDLKGVMKILVETQQYIYDVMSLKASMFQSCVSRSPNCASLALHGDCTSNPSWMVENCPAVCGLCL